MLGAITWEKICPFRDVTMYEVTVDGVILPISRLWQVPLLSKSLN